MSYTEPFLVVEVRRGILSGQLGKEFLRLHNLTGDLTPYIRSADSIPFSICLDAVRDGGKSFYNANLASDGRFEVELPPGTYDLKLVVMGSGYTLKQRIPVENGIVVEENRRKVVIRP